MGNLKKINIYVGVVGQAYVDKETAKSNLDRAKQNINDWNNIITLAQSVLDNTNPVSSRLIDAQSKATAVKTLLQTEMNNAINDTEKYAALSKLFNDLNALDYDNDFSNGGNTYTLDQINNALNSIIQEINDILSKSQSNQTYWEGAVAEYQQAYDTAVEVFNSYIPEDQNNPLDENDDLEAQFTERLHEIDAQLQEFNTAIGKVNEVSDKTNEEIEKILGTAGPDEPAGPEAPANNYYIGRSDKEVFTLDDLDQYVAEKPSEITLPGGDNASTWAVWIYPESWGKPTKAVSNHSMMDEISSFLYEELTIPEGYIGCYSLPGEDDTYTLEW